MHPPEKFDLQDQQYDFPYHYIPTALGPTEAKRYRVLKWGFEYLCYQRHIVGIVQSYSPMSVLEVGCGDGYFIGSLGREIACRVGVDFSEKAIAFARAFHPEVSFQAGDAAAIDREFDVVVAIEVLEHIPDEEVHAFLRTLFARTKDGGRVVISVPSVVLPLNKKHYRHYTADLLCAQVAEACPDGRKLKVEYICRIPWWVSLYDRLTVNRHWMLDVSVVSSWIWRVLWRKHRLADASGGRHIVAVFEKRAAGPVGA